MSITIIGRKPLEPDSDGKLQSHVATIFLNNKVTLLTEGPTHYDQREVYTAIINKELAAQGHPQLTTFDEKFELWECAVDLIVTGDCILIRPDPKNMKLALEADKALQSIASKRSIRFMYANNPDVQKAIREIGEYWRICPYPQLKSEVISTIEKSRISIDGDLIYYYSAPTGTRYITCSTFSDLTKRDDAYLRSHLLEIQNYSARRNKLYNSEVDFFAADSTFDKKAFKDLDFESASPEQLRALHKKLSEDFTNAVPRELRRDNTGDIIWRNRIFATLMDERNESLAINVVSDLTPEFFRMIHWLPGGRIHKGELIFDSIFNDKIKYVADKDLQSLCDERVKCFIVNYVHEFGNIEYVNIGRIMPSIRNKEDRTNGHQVYIAELKYLGADKPIIRILRIQQWGMLEHLNRGRDKLYAFEQSMEYTDFTRDRRLACWELGMPLPGRIVVNSITEIYNGTQEKYHGHRIRTTYYEREFIKGLATDKIPDEFIKEPDFSDCVASLLGHAAAPNMVVGRTAGAGSTEVVFDSGDEMLLFNSEGHPDRIVVADHAGTFHDYTSNLKVFAKGYAEPVIQRANKVHDLQEFTNHYLKAMQQRLLELKEECRIQESAFRILFQNSKQGPQTFSDRWDKARKRLQRTDVPELINCIRKEIETVTNSKPQ